ncbi:bifunctional heparan sulfate N-deacetylase/N-sulfotransferase [Folsomia candida]|uniref:bifunctional heparan sulfate N-deacetylase/N-sulfotransferase n=1 Tax=Folsomia candida TaxID=158441 RepID=UPI000B906A2A|nr:bifunctional heparan sulfate N-deacetylase/N-sulfotransferase [Folsomia candida]XP_035701316.1 bifunctional heparan sulfate N-deacetylase/N-sulfotransferase [Folsomia candida]
MLDEEHARILDKRKSGGGGGSRVLRFFLWLSCWGWNLRRRLHLVTAKRWLFLVILATTAYVIYSSCGKPAQVHPPLYGLMRTRPEVLYRCPTLSSSGERMRKYIDHATISAGGGNRVRMKIDPKVLLFVETTFSKLGRDLAELLVHNRMKYKVEVSGKSLPVLRNGEKGRFSTILFENYTKYLSLDEWNRNILDKYCAEFDIGIVGFMPSRDETFVGAELRNTAASLLIDTNVRIKDAYLNPSSSVLRLTRAGDIVRGPLPNEPSDLWTVFYPNHTTYEAVSMATPFQEGGEAELHAPPGTVNIPLVTVVQDKGEADGIRRVIFGAGLKFWLHRLLLLDAISYSSRGRLSVSLKRYILIDIDDIFVGERGTRLKKSDVEAILTAQEGLRRLVPGFKFNLGFSAKYFHFGDDEENAGDDLILENSDKFMWFGHMWNHIQPHLYSNLTQLMLDMMKNKDFAKEHGIPTDFGYSVSPHHSGVYPVHDLLFDAWKKVWNVKVTSTEEYPHLRPARLRRGFIHRGIMVLPRQTCGLFTHTIFIDRYPGGQSKLDESIWGGELFQSVVYNSINVFMTHMSNYGNDRLGLYTFESVIKYVQCWTNLQMVTLPPVLLAEKYFKMHPDEGDPIWGNPCDDPRHRKIWSSNKTCDSLPQFLVIGPQKTGTTALYTFLTMHPAISSNKPSPETFEEVQFFNGKNYLRGLDWYLKFFASEEVLPTTNVTTSFAHASSSFASDDDANAHHNAVPTLPPFHEEPPPHTKRILFEKSATYFDNELVPKRAHALLPRAKLVTILISPAKRAHSWYQHMRAHNDSVALNYTFYEVLTASVGSPKVLRDLRNRCLNPGRYAQNLERWLSYFPPQQLLILDGEELRDDPVAVMYRLQRFLQIQPLFDYSTKLRYDRSKGFYCQVISQNRNKCLGRSKGRHYPPMDDRSEKYLQSYYKSHNSALEKLLRRLDHSIPPWLREDLIE